MVFGSHMPALASWLTRFALPSALSIVATFAALRFTQRAPLRARILAETPTPPLTRAGRWAAFGIALSAAVLLTASAFDVRLGWPTLLVAAITSGAVLLEVRESPLGLLKPVSPGVCCRSWPDSS